MWQGVGACGSVRGSGRGLGLQHRQRHVAGVEGCGACDMVWGHVAGVMAGCGGMWQGLGYLVEGQAYGIDGDMWQGWGM